MSPLTLGRLQRAAQLSSWVQDVQLGCRGDIALRKVDISPRIRVG